LDFHQELFLGTSVLWVTLIAIDRAIFSGLKRNFTFLAAINTDRLIHLAVGPHICFFSGSTIRASLGGILKPLLLVEFLLGDGPDKIFTAVFAF
jgi:hypothetical protein